MRTALTLFLTLLVGPTVLAAPPAVPRVAIVVTPKSARDQAHVAELEKLLVASLERTGHRRVYFVEPFDAECPVDTAAKLEAARKLSIADPERRRTKETETAYFDALLRAKACLAEIPGRDLAEMHVGMALGAFVSKNAAVTDAMLLAAIGLNPELSEREVPGELVPAFRLVAATVQRAPMTRLSLRTTPPGATVLLGDRVVGTTPLELKDVPAVPTVVRLRRDGFYSAGSLMTPSAGNARAISTVNTTLKPLPGRARFETWMATLLSAKASDAERTEASDRLASIFGADHIVLLSATKVTAKGRSEYVLSGTVARSGVAPRAITTTLPLDATLLDNAKALVRDWLPPPAAPPAEKKSDATRGPQPAPPPEIAPTPSP